jgi:hypothetical protein
MQDTLHLFEQLEEHKQNLTALEKKSLDYGNLQIPHYLIESMEHEIGEIERLEREVILRQHIKLPEEVRLKPLDPPHNATQITQVNNNNSPIVSSPANRTSGWYISLLVVLVVLALVFLGVVLLQF